MKKGQEIIVKGWQNYIDEKPIKPEGFSSIAEIAKKTGHSPASVRRKLSALREEGKVEAVRVLIGKYWQWVYKDSL